MQTQTHRRRRRTRITGFLALLGASVLGGIGLPVHAASAAPLHRLDVTGTLDIKDHDVARDDWCRNRPMGMRLSVDHGANPVADGILWSVCDEVRIELVVRGELMSDERI